MASSIFIVGQSQAMCLLLTKCLEANQHNVFAASTDEEIRLCLETTDPDIVLADSGSDSPSDLLERLSRNGLSTATSDKAPIIVLDRNADPKRRVMALSAGARDLIGWPLDQRLLLARIRGMLREVNAAREVRRRESAAIRMGFSEDTATFTPAQSVAFVVTPEKGSRLDDIEVRGLGASVRRLSPKQAIAGEDGSAQIDTFVVDGTNLSTSASFNTLPELRSRDHSRHAGILFIHDADDPHIAASALDSGATDILASDALPDELIHRVNALLLRKQEEDALRRSNEKSMELAVTDPLTGLFNRRYAQSYLQDVIAQTNGAETLTVMIVDIDHFKRINDTHGHAVGDIVLAEVARRMRDTLRAIDMVARFGGEEFLVVMPSTEMSQAGPAADRIRDKIGGAPILIEGGKTVRVTVSIGVSVASKAMLTNEETYAFAAQETGSTDQVARLLQAADKALYFAKEMGRNRIKVAEETS